MSDKVLVVCASRDRDDLLERMIATVRATSDADVAVYVDYDQRSAYSRFTDGMGVIGPRIGPCAALNNLIERFPGYSLYVAATDDCAFLTPGWDRWALEQAKYFPAGIGMLSPWNHSSERMDFPCATRGWIEALGWLCPPKVKHFYWDVLLEILADELSVIRYAGADEWEMSHDDIRNEGRYELLREDALVVVKELAFNRKPMLDKLTEAIK